MTAQDPENYPQAYRNVLGQYPTGVCVVAAESSDTGRCGMVVGSFTSVSLDPPLVAFFPAKTSTSWPKIERAGRFCVNILGADQEDVCRTFFASAGDRFATLSTSPAPGGAPIIDGSLAWIECTIESVQEAGDHFVVLGRVRALDALAGELPLVFFRGGYGRFSSLSLAAPDVRGVLTGSLRDVDPARPLMERFADDYGCYCIASAMVADEVVVVASAGQSQGRPAVATLVGQRLPFAPPMGSVFAAWGDEAETKAWLRRAGDDASRERHRLALEAVRSRGVSVALRSSAQREFATHMETSAVGRRPMEPTALEGLMPQLSYDPAELDEVTRQAIRQ